MSTKDFGVVNGLRLDQSAIFLPYRGDIISAKNGQIFVGHPDYDPSGMLLEELLAQISEPDLDPILSFIWNTVEYKGEAGPGEFGSNSYTRRLWIAARVVHLRFRQIIPATEKGFRAWLDESSQKDFVLRDLPADPKTAVEFIMAKGNLRPEDHHAKLSILINWAYQMNGCLPEDTVEVYFREPLEQCGLCFKEDRHKGSAFIFPPFVRIQ